MKRTLSFILALVLLLGLMPMQVSAIENEANPWEGRSTVFVGDSITAGSGTTKIYYEFLEESLGFGSVTPMGVAGSCISAASDYGQSNQPLINRYQNIPSADLIVFFMGTNDYGHETPLSNVGNTQDGTFYGALNVIIPALVAKHTSSKIVFVTPLHRYGFGTSKILGTKFTSDDVANGVGATLGDYVNALKTVCANNGVSVIDLYTECTLDPTDAETRTNYMPDGLHPNAAGHEVVAGIMESHIRGFAPAEQEPVEQNEMVYGNRFAPGNNQTCRASSRINYYLKTGTVITLKDPAAMQWACTKTSDETSSSNRGYFPDSAWSDKETAVVEADGWVGFVFKYRDETQVFDLTKPLSEYIIIEYITVEESGADADIHFHDWSNWTELVAPTCDAEGTDCRVCETCGEEQNRDTRITGDPSKILVSDPLTKDYFAGKRVLLIGDSITAGVGTTKTYGAYLAELLGVTVTNKGSSGSGYCSGGAMATNKNLTEANVRNADIITIMLGVNDWDWAVKEGSWKGNPEYYDKSQTYYQLGDFNSTDTSTFYGALHAWCQKILAMQQIAGFEDKQFIVITPLITSWNVSVTSKKDWNQDKLNIHGHTFREYCTAIMEVCAYYDIPVLDANMFSGIYYYGPDDNNVDLTGGDGVHPSAAGHALIAESIVEFLLEGYSYEERQIENCGHAFSGGECVDCHLPCPHSRQRLVETVAPSCTEEGYTVNECADCGNHLISNYTSPPGHDLIHHDAKEATCTEIGWGAYDTCSRCDYSTYAKIPAKGHDLIHHDAKEATFFESGWDEYDECTRCDYSTFVEIPAIEYDPGDFDDDGFITDSDAIYLLYSVLFGEKDYPLNQPGDLDGDGELTDSDAVYLLYHVLFGEDDYPILQPNKKGPDLS